MTIMHTDAVPIMDRYEINEITGCWLWLGYVDKNGYARLDGENAHRAFYRKHVGVIADGNDIDHLCKRRDCVNPAHLESITELENNRRKSRTVRYQGKQFDICRHGHPMTGDNLRLYKRAGGGVRRLCAECARARDRKSRTLPNALPPATLGVLAYSGEAPGRESEHSASRTTNERLPG